MLGAAGLFGYADTLRLRNADSPHGLILFVAILLGVAFLYLLFVKKRYIPAAAAGALCAGVFLWFVTTKQVPPEFLSFTPHIVTLLVLAFAAQRLRPPAADGKPYRRGQQI